MKCITLLFTVFLSHAVAQALPNCEELFTQENDVAIGYKCALDNKNKLVYERVERTGFGIAWKDPNGLIWSDTQKYLHGEIIGSFDDGWVRCENLGAHLPLPAEFEKFGEQEQEGSHIPLEWYGRELFTSVLDTTRPLLSPYVAITGKTRNFSLGLVDRRARREAFIVCVDDSAVKVKKQRPAQPAPIL